MFVNVWGHVNSPGLHEVYDGIDLATLMSMVGGPKPGANLKTVRLYREVPEEDGQMVYTINLDSFFQSGNRSEFIKVKPNDTIVIPQKFSNYILGQVGTLNTFLSMMNIYLQIQRSN
jgi:protein involved in polysaccharide export with SLBB domain